MPNNILILLAGEFPASQSELREIWAENPHFIIAGEVMNAADLLVKADELDPQLIILDLDLGGGNILDTITTLKERRPQQQILVLASRSDTLTIFAVIKAGVLGFVLLPESTYMLANAISDVARGESALSPRIARRLINELHRPSSLPSSEEPLAEREIDVLLLLTRGFSNLEIATTLEISERTVRTYISNILSKLHLANRTQAAQWALKEGIVEESHLSQHFKRVREICQQLRGTLEGRLDGELAFYLGGKAYAAYLHHTQYDHPFVLLVPVPYGTQNLLLKQAPHKFFVAPRYVDQGWIAIDLTQIDEEELRHYLHQAWELVSS